MSSRKADLTTDYMPRYASVMHDIVCKIHDGVYPPGSKLPSVRELAKEYQTSHHVVHFAIGQLAYQNYLYTEPKSGTFVNPELHAGLFYRIAFILNENNPMEHGMTIVNISRVAGEACFKTVLVNNFGSSKSIPELLMRDAKFDGLLVLGEVDEALLNGIAGFKIPYMVIGNYEISAKHPQCRLDVAGSVFRSLSAEFRPFAGKKIAALMGSSKYVADRDAVEGVKRAIQEIGAVSSDALIAACPSDGYHECVRIMKEEPDVLYIRYALKVGYQKYRLRNADAPHPFVIYDCDALPGSLPPAGDFDRVINSSSTYEITERATRSLIETILQKKGV